MAEKRDSNREAGEGDYTDPRKSKEVDSSYDADYLKRRDKFVDEMRAKKKKGKKA